ncbi:hypothetical protein F2Q69_00058279 [Brassica cretica]|uniref:Trehalose-6-phosphate synthase n=1 Tax=Brassica cretica TaxID=69181 RepID=A0A8S9RKA2_BRACR|nr:hypothetical protein F2Q69_00058279 [Brassica cretica]
MGFFLHSPFPSSEIYRSLPVREEILKALLNSDLIGFHTFDYARHFLTCCSRMLGLEYQSKRGYIGLEYYGRTVGIKIMPVGINMGRIQSVMRYSEEEGKVMELRKRYEGKTVLLGIDDMDIFKGINLKLLAMEQMLNQHSNWRGRAVLVQIVNPARGKGIDIDEIRGEIEGSCKRINEEFGKPGYQPIVYIDTPVSVNEIIAYYHIAECVVVTAVRDGMNLTPYEYIVCRQGLLGSESDFNGPKKSMLVASEFIGCSPSLSGAIRVNPWNVEATGEALNEALSMRDPEKQLRHEKHFRYGVSKGSVAEKIFSSMDEKGKPVDFVLCIGDDRSDEDMFEAIGNAMSKRLLCDNALVFACTVGQKPSKAKYYLDDTMEVTSMLESLAEASEASNFSMRELDEAL